jgi:glycosyltransferase involved in cell wall biosynthesis
VKKYPDWRLVMCGVGNVEEVKSFISENGVGDNVDLPGWVEGGEREKFFNNAYAYCMTSRKEGLPMAVLESLSIGIPVISTPVGCLPEFLTTDENIVFFDFEDADNLAKQMIRLIEDKELYNRLSENGVQVIADSFTSTKVFEKLDRIYQEIV